MSKQDYTLRYIRVWKKTKIIMELVVEKFTDEKKEIWDEFVANNLFGTVFHSRRFLSYHRPDRFEDASIMVYDKEKLICVVPANKSTNGYFSHNGATYGGPVIDKNNYTVRKMPEIINLIFHHYKNSISFRVAGDIYFNESTALLHYLLNTKCSVQPELSWHINTTNLDLSKSDNKKNKKYLKDFMKDRNLEYFKTKEKKELNSYHSLLSTNLRTRFGTEPTHTLDEFLLLNDLLGDDCSLYVAKYNGTTLAGMFVINVTRECWYTIYIYSDHTNKKSAAALMFVAQKIAEDAHQHNVEYVDFGITTENKGQFLNRGLSSFKEKSLCGVSGSRYLFIKNND